jgi:hypothetical protein
VGSAANAKVGVIVGYVGGSHVALDAKDAHAATLMSGVKADDGRGADIVISDFTDLLPLVEYFRARTPRRRPNFPKETLDKLKAKYYLP